jgi:hypothetical protein
LESGLLSQESFRDFAKKHVLFAHITTRIPGRKDDDLLGRKGGRGFPHVVAMDAEGRVLARLTSRTLEGFETMMAKASESLALRQQADLSNEKRIELLSFDLEVGNLDAAGAQAEIARMKDLTDAQKTQLDGMLVDAEIRGHMQGVTSRELAAAAGAKFYEMARAGKRPSDAGLAASFWQWQLLHGEMNKKPNVFEFAMNEVLKLPQLLRHPNRAQIEQNLKAKLEELKAAAAAPKDD